MIIFKGDGVDDMLVALSWLWKERCESKVEKCRLAALRDKDKQRDYSLASEKTIKQTFV